MADSFRLTSPMLDFFVAFGLELANEGRKPRGAIGFKFITERGLPEANPLHGYR